MLDHDTVALHRLDDDGGPCPPHDPTPRSFMLATFVNDGSDPDGPYYNGLRFATADETEAYGRDLYSRWIALKRFEVRRSTDPITHRMVDGKVFSLSSLAGGEGRS